MHAERATSLVHHFDVLFVQSSSYSAALIYTTSSLLACAFTPKSSLQSGEGRFRRRHSVPTRFRRRLPRRKLTVANRHRFSRQNDNPFRIKSDETIMTIHFNVETITVAEMSISSEPRLIAARYSIESMATGRKKNPVRSSSARATILRDPYFSQTMRGAHLFNSVIIRRGFLAMALDACVLAAVQLNHNDFQVRIERKTLVRYVDVGSQRKFRTSDARKSFHKEV